MEEALGLGAVPVWTTREGLPGQDSQGRESSNVEAGEQISNRRMLHVPSEDLAGEHVIVYLSETNARPALDFEDAMC